MKELRLFGEKPKPKKADNKGREVRLLSEMPKEFFKMRKADKNAD